MSERADGWYWCKDEPDDEWYILQWELGEWNSLGFEPIIIGPRIPPPNEPWQTVPTEPTEEMLCAAEIAAANKEADMSSPSPTEHPDDGGGPAGYYYRALLAAAPKP